MVLSINRITISMEIFFKNPVLLDNVGFTDAFQKNGFTRAYGTPETPVMAKGRFTARTARAPRARARAINVGALAVAANDMEKFVQHIMTVKEILAKELKIDLWQEFKNCSVITNAWVRTGNDSGSILGRIKDINDIQVLKGFTCHRTPFEKLEFVSESPQGMLDYDEWRKLEVDSAQAGEYLLSLHYYGNSLQGVTGYLGKIAEEITSIVNSIESKVLQESR